jgi:PAS domain S-box-containing protein
LQEYNITFVKSDAFGRLHGKTGNDTAPSVGFGQFDLGQGFLSAKPRHFVAARDQQELGMAIQELARRRQDVGILAAVSDVAIIATDMTGTITLFNRGAECMFGYKAAEVLGIVTPAMFHRDAEVAAHWFEMATDIDPVAETASREFHEWTYVRKDGTDLIGSTSVSTVCSVQGEIIGKVAVITDITERRLAERRLQESELLLRESQSAVGLGSYMLDLASGLWRSSDVLDDLMGIDKHFDRSVTGWADLVHPDDRAMVTDYFYGDVLGKLQNFDKSYRIVRADDGVERWVHGRGKVELDGQGRPLRMYGTIQDITDRRKAEQDRRLAERVFAASHNAVVITDTDNLIIDVNPAFTRVTGFDREEVLGRSPKILASGRHGQEFYRALWDSLLQRGFWQGEIWNRRKDGQIYAELLAVSTIRDSADALQNYVGIFTDITDIKQAQAAMLQSQKLQAVGTLANGIAHDFNNILTTILGFNQLVVADIEDPGVVSGHVDQIRRAALRAKELIARLMAFSSPANAVAGAFDLIAAIQEIMEFLDRTVPPNVSVILNLPPGEALIQGTVVQFQQIIMNLCLNAIDAIGTQDGGEIAISLNETGQNWRLVVSDNGCGISAEALPNIFDPFFTTKAEKTGTGLGLSVVHGVVTSLGGTVSVQSQPGVGTSFLIEFAQAGTQTNC